MHNIIIGTAGHVDHGKTCLIKALSGFDTDRLKEEKKRGITIDLGFANLPNDAGLHIGIIDVPGHEKFVKNMLAGIGGIDLVLLVISLEEGVMPQTVEHFEILKMLHIKQGIVVLTKEDAVDTDWADAVEEDVIGLVKDSFLENAPMIRVSSYTGKNISKLKDMIISMVADLAGRREEAELFRLYVDRVFTMEGFGTVVTGTLQEGSVKTGDDVVLYPAGREIKIRGIQSHGQKEEQAFAGQRTALNLLNVKKEELSRGDILAYPGSIIKTKLIDVKVNTFKTSTRELRSGDRIHLNYGSAQVMAKVILLSKDFLRPGESDYAQLRFDDDVVLKRNDRFIIRFLSPVETFGGGVVLDIAPLKHKKKDEAVLENMKIKELGSDFDTCELKIAEESHRFPDRHRLAGLMGMTSAEILNIIDTLKTKKKIIVLSDDTFIHLAYWKTITDFSQELLKNFHKENPIKEGMGKEEFKSKLSEQFRLKDSRKSLVLLEELVKRMVVKINASFVADRDFLAEYSAEMNVMLGEIKDIYIKAGIEAPLTVSVIDEFKDKNAAKEVIADLLKNNELIKLNPAVYINAQAYNDALNTLVDFMKDKKEFTLAEFRDLFSTSRKFALQFLEYTDKKRITKLNGDKRVLLKNI